MYQSWIPTKVSNNQFLNHRVLCLSGTHNFIIHIGGEDYNSLVIINEEITSDFSCLLRSRTKQWIAEDVAEYITLNKSQGTWVQPGWGLGHLGSKKCGPRCACSQATREVPPSDPTTQRYPPLEIRCIGGQISTVSPSSRLWSPSPPSIYQ